jgi:hypothetical protein
MAAKSITANRLHDGEVVYLTAAGAWSERLAEAAVAIDDAGSAALLAKAQADAAAARVVDPYAIDVDTGADEPRPLRYREVLRARGPSVRVDLGKQAEAADVSL